MKPLMLCRKVPLFTLVLAASSVAELPAPLPDVSVSYSPYVEYDFP